MVDLLAITRVCLPRHNSTSDPAQTPVLVPLLATQPDIHLHLLWIQLLQQCLIHLLEEGSFGSFMTVFASRAAPLPYLESHYEGHIAICCFTCRD